MPSRRTGRYQEISQLQFSSLTTNYTQNLATVRANLVESLSQSVRSPEELAVLQRALHALDHGHTIRAVTNANIANGAGILSGVRPALQSAGIRFIYVMR